MSSRKLRITPLFVLLVGTLVISGLGAPASLAQEEGDLVVSIVEGQQPADAGKNDLITASPFDSSSPADGFVQVQVSKYVLIEESLELMPAEEGEVEVKFSLESGAGLASGTLSVTPELTDEGGIATFDSSLSIAETNAFMTTDYQIVPQARYSSEITLLEEGWPFEGDPSTGFDIWEDGCSGTGCNVNLRSNLETYTAQGNFGLAASQLSANLVTCPTQRVIFSGKTFFHVTTGNESEVVFLVTHITRADMKAAANNGQRHVGLVHRARVAWPVGAQRRRVHAADDRREDVLRRDGAEVPQQEDGAPVRAVHRQPVGRQRRRQLHPWVRPRWGPAPPHLGKNGRAEAKGAPDPDGVGRTSFLSRLGRSPSLRTSPVVGQFGVAI